MCRNDRLSWVFTNRFNATRCMKDKRMGTTEILRRIWLFSADKTKIFESGSKQPTQLIVELNSLLRHKIVTKNLSHLSNVILTFPQILRSLSSFPSQKTQRA